MNRYYRPTDALTYVELTQEQEADYFRRYYEGDKEAEKFIMGNFLKLAAKMALQFSAGRLPEEAAISAGNFALVKALRRKKFDPSRGNKFGSYLRAYVRYQILKTFATLTKEIRFSDLGDEEAQKLNEKIVAEQQEPGHIGPGEAGLFYKQVRKAMKDMDANERKFTELFVIEHNENLADIGREMGVSREGIRKIQLRVLEQLRKPLAMFA